MPKLKLWQPKDAQTSATTQNDSEKKPSRLLHLPAELRNSIYAFALAYCLTRLSQRSDLQTDCPLVSVFKQVNSELKSLLVSDSPSLQTTVQDFNFSHVIYFFNNLSDIDFRRINRTTDSGDVTMEIRLTFKGRNLDCKNGFETGKHTSWYKWLATTERGKAVGFRYAWKRTMNTKYHLDNYVRFLRSTEELKQKARLAKVAGLGG